MHISLWLVQMKINKFNLLISPLTKAQQKLPFGKGRKSIVWRSPVHSMYHIPLDGRTETFCPGRGVNFLASQSCAASSAPWEELFFLLSDTALYTNIVWQDYSSWECSVLAIPISVDEGTWRWARVEQLEISVYQLLVLSGSSILLMPHLTADWNELWRLWVRNQSQDMVLESSL